MPKLILQSWEIFRLFPSSIRSISVLPSGLLIGSKACFPRSPTQSAFVEGRKITENVLLAQELFILRNYHRKTGKSRCAIKMDFLFRKLLTFLPIWLSALRLVSPPPSSRSPSMGGLRAISPEGRGWDKEIHFPPICLFLLWKSFPGSFPKLLVMEGSLITRDVLSWIWLTFVLLMISSSLILPSRSPISLCH